MIKVKARPFIQKPKSTIRCTVLESPTLAKQGEHTYYLCTLEVETERSEFKAILSYTRVKDYLVPRGRPFLREANKTGRRGWGEKYQTGINPVSNV